MKMIPMVDLQSQYQKIKGQVDAAMQEVCQDATFINGPQVKSFAENLKDYLSVGHIIPCANGTDALQIALMALDLKPGDEVITPSFTYIATVEVVALLGLTPVFVDVDRDSYTMSVEDLEKKITDKTKVIIPVHLYGQCANMEKILEIAESKGIHVVEDTAQAIGADYSFSDGTKTKAGTMGKVGSTSFFPSKNLGCYGDGGALFSNDEVLSDAMRMIANHGQSQRYIHDRVGCNSRLDSIQAAVLNVKLPLLDEYNSARQSVAKFYDSAFEGNAKIVRPKVMPYSSHVYHQYTMVLESVNRDAVKQKLEENGVSSMIYYPIACHNQKMITSLGVKTGPLPNTDYLTDRVLSLPIHTEMDEKTLEYIAEQVIEAVK